MLQVKQFHRKSIQHSDLVTAARPHVAASASPSDRGGSGGGGADEEPDWEAEMSIFKQRISRPNQLATLRELEAKVSVGKVLYARDGLAIVCGLNTDAPLGTKVSFVTGTAGVLLWHRSDNLSFCLVLGDPTSVTDGTPVECKIKGVLQVWVGVWLGLGAELLRQGLVKDERGRDMTVAPPPGAPAAADGADAAAAAAEAAPSASAPGGGVGGAPDDDSALVEYEGMLVSGAVAQRRGFLSTFFMRAAKMSRANGGGSMSLLPLVPGTCATGVSKRIDMSKYKTLSPEQLAKLEAALRAKQLAEELAAGGGSGELATEVVEEFISIADGQVVLDRAQRQQQQAAAAPSPSPSPSPSVAYTVNPKLSITRIGTRAYHKAMEQLAPQVRLDLAQADDARRFSASASSPLGSAASGNSMASADLLPGAGSGPGSAEERADALARRLSAALLQRPGRPAQLPEQVVTLYAVQRGFADAVPPEQVPAWLEGAVAHVAAEAAAALEELGRTGILTAAAEAGIATALRSFRWQP
ncbi:hypothetical protein GPECTOR_6g752 [Gonium pectorale]|uniref:ATP synthase alpha subunit C-terminal domain-containing protein n=1 Tax=Gonium pectorale TaxID=33097 RepID=A0A150GVL3_GONPE|nr:hypothetical protein GPECTOR_6g752 [Gonium pectorale]|eukprot:KXZ53834.1 hypothetical protein GPECTOR_6g752 [Gonium pectorale]